MDNNINKQVFEKLSFWQLLENRSVEIPIIQRDYAQGRAKKEKVRNDFLDALKNALTGKPVELDFVYGNEEKNALQPLDGQQRLTTLFLLHWFIANKEGRLNEAKERLLKFTYKTRTSSREFCKELIDKSIDYENLLSIDKEKKITTDNQLSETIKNASWFVISWKNDPTISAMLIMLDAIQAKFKDSSDLWQELTKEDKCPITFLYIKLENFGLSDDLYIKMNARGKALTPFENFKSRFEKHIKENGWEKEITNPKETFAHKIDTVWTDLFWKYREKIERKNKDDKTIVEYKIDDRLTNFIAGTAINCYAQNLEIQSNKDDEEKVRKELEEKGKTKTISDEAVKRERIEQRIAILFNSPSEIAPYDFPTKEAFKCLTDYLSKYSEEPLNYSNCQVKPNIPLWNNGSIDKTSFEELILGENFTLQKRVMFYAQTLFLLNKAFNQDDFNDYMRVIRNVVENATGNWSLERMMSAIRFVSELMNVYKSYSNIYSILADTTTIFSFNAEQVKEEIEKAKIIVDNPNTKQLIHDTEDTNFCKGKIDFALYCTDYDIDKKPKSTVLDKDKLGKILLLITSNFDNMETKISDDFKRAFLTIGSNDYYEVWRSWSHSFDSHKRWLLGKHNDLKEFSLQKDWKRDYLKELFIQLVDKGTFKNIVSNYAIPTVMPNWKQRLIKEGNLLKGATFILIPNNNLYCKLAWQQKPSREDQVKKIE